MIGRRRASSVGVCTEEAVGRETSPPALLHQAMGSSNHGSSVSRSTTRRWVETW